MHPLNRSISAILSTPLLLNSLSLASANAGYPPATRASINEVQARVTEEALADIPIASHAWFLRVRNLFQMLSLAGARTSSGGGIAALRERLNIQLGGAKTEPIRKDDTLTLAESLVKGSVVRLINSRPELGHKRAYFHWIDSNAREAYAYARRLVGPKKIGLDRIMFNKLTTIYFSPKEP